jgi:hypothetical protein
MYETVESRMQLFNRMDKLSSYDRRYVELRLQGALTVLCDNKKLWQELEKFILERESQQTPLPLTLTDELNGLIDKAHKNILDSSKTI